MYLEFEGREDWRIGREAGQDGLASRPGRKTGRREGQAVMASHWEEEARAGWGRGRGVEGGWSGCWV